MSSLWGMGPRGLARVKNVNVTLAELIFEAQPYQRQIIMMREPVSRYYSAFHYYRQGITAHLIALDGGI